MAGHAKFSHDKDVERRGEGMCDFVTNGNTAARQGQHHDIATPFVA